MLGISIRSMLYIQVKYMDLPVEPNTLSVLDFFSQTMCPSYLKYSILCSGMFRSSQLASAGFTQLNKLNGCSCMPVNLCGLINFNIQHHFSFSWYRDEKGMLSQDCKPRLRQWLLTTLYWKGLMFYSCSGITTMEKPSGFRIFCSETYNTKLWCAYTPINISNNELVALQGWIPLYSLHYRCSSLHRWLFTRLFLIRGWWSRFLQRRSDWLEQSAIFEIKTYNSKLENILDYGAQYPYMIVFTVLV